MDAATIEETNRIRVSLGLKPLPVPGADPAAQSETKNDDDDGEAPSTVESRQAQSYDNYNKAMEAESLKKKREERNAAIKKARENAQRLAQLEGKGLGEEDNGGDLDTKAWLVGQKKRQKKIDKARKLEDELAAAEAEAAAAVQYTSKDLAGIKVAHDSAALLDGGDQILTLKDTTIEENEEDGDELENVNLRDQEKLEERLDLLKKRPGYNPNDDEDEVGGILAQYDEEIDGKQTKRFTLGANGSIAELADILDQPAHKTVGGGQNINLDDIVGDAPISSDYLAASEIKVKKPKKKKNKKTRQKPLDEDDVLFTEPVTNGDEAMDIDTNAAGVSKKRKLDLDVVEDDEDLQASLAAQRKLALKKRKKTRPEDLAKQLKEEEKELDESGPDADADNGAGLVIGEISEFVSGLSKRDDEEEEEERRQKRKRQAAKTPTVVEEEDLVMEDVPTKLEQLADQGIEAEEATQDGDGFGEEKHVSQGMGAALALLRERGLIEESKGDELHLERRRQDFLTGKRLLEDELDDQTRNQRERDRMSGKMDKMSTREREDYARQQNQWRDQHHSRKMAEHFSSNYKPTFKLKYTDDHGRDLNQKEAFKQLSHQFHGKGSGKGKTEKRLKKIDDEKRREAQSMFDASQQGGMSMATSQQLKKRKEAGVRLG